MDTKEKITELLTSTNRNCIEKLIAYLEIEGFFEAPASSRFHGSYAGGLADHSLAVFEKLEKLIVLYYPLKLDAVSAPGQKPLPIHITNIIIATLLHDVCKIGAYIPTPEGKEPYKWNKGQPKGHALLSIERIKKYIELKDIEELMIKFHMGVYGLREFYEEGSWEYKTNAEYSLRGDHSKDDNLSKEESRKARYGKSMRNAWYHNPICKLMYLCDELAMLEAKAKENEE